MKRVFLVGLGVLAASVTVSVFALEQQTSTSPVTPAAVTLQLVGGGHWQSQKRTVSLGGPATRLLGAGWQVQLKQMQDNSLAGRITIVGSPLIQQARIEGQISGSDVDGVLVDDSNAQIGTFTGTLSNGSVSGTYTTAAGDTGNWSWDGPLPAAQAAVPVAGIRSATMTDQTAAADAPTPNSPTDQSAGSEAPVSQ